MVAGADSKIVGDRSWEDANIRTGVDYGINNDSNLASFQQESDDWPLQFGSERECGIRGGGQGRERNLHTPVRLKDQCVRGRDFHHDGVQLTKLVGGLLGVGQVRSVGNYAVASEGQSQPFAAWGVFKDGGKVDWLHAVPLNARMGLIEGLVNVVTLLRPNASLRQLNRNGKGKCDEPTGVCELPHLKTEVRGTRHTAKTGAPPGLARCCRYEGP